MKKLLFTLALILFCTSYGKAQNCDSIAQSIVEQIKNYSPNDLLPYYDKESNNWGLMSKKGKILTQPLYYFPAAFDPDYHIYSDICDITIMGKDYTYEAGFTEIMMAMGPANQQDPNIKGFTTVNKVNRVTGNTWYEIDKFSSRFNDVYYPFERGGKSYATAVLAENGKRGIIDKDGNVLIDFKYKSLDFIKNYKDDKQFWFYYEDDNGVRGFVNDKGETKLADELLSYADGIFSLQTNDKQWGVLDLRNLTWAIKPQAELQLERLVLVGQDLENKNCYAVVNTKDGEKYLIDMRKKAYKAKIVKK